MLTDAISLDKKEGAALGFLLALSQLGKGVPIKLLLSAPMGFLSYFWPENPAPLIALFVIYGIDYLTGFMAAVKNKNVSSRVMVKGLGKLMAYLLIIIAVNEAVKVSPEFLSWLPEVVFAYLALTEITSIFENLNKLGIDTPGTKVIYRVLRENNIFKMRETVRIEKKKATKKRKKKR